jgi:MFS family permease
MTRSSTRAIAGSLFLLSFGLVLFELVLTRLFGVVLFAAFAHLALGLALLGISLGAVLQHLVPSLVPEEGLERRLGWLALSQGAFTVLAVVCTLGFPLTTQTTDEMDNLFERSSLTWQLLDGTWFALLLPLLTLPFAATGLAFSGIFQRRKEHIGGLYGADLVGGAVGAMLFVPILDTLAGPDTAFVVTLTSGLAALLLFRQGQSRAGAGVAVAAVAVSAILLGVSGAGHELLRVRYAAGYPEQNVTYSRWTALTRLSIHEDRRGAYVLLDNTSASQVILTERERADRASEPNRALVYRLYQPGARIAILAASAGPEVAVAQSFGHTGIEAIDIAAIGRLVAERYPDVPVNPFLVGGTRIVEADGRAAILFSDEPYDIIQMVHANLHSSAGLMAEAWSPSLLETREAFVTYLEHLTPDGTLSFARGVHTRELLASIRAALVETGVEEPERCVLYVGGAATFVLVKKRPWTKAERDEAVALVKSYPQERVRLDPRRPDPEAFQERQGDSALMTDNRPYPDSPERVREALRSAFSRIAGKESGEVGATEAIYHTLAIQAAFVLVVGALLVAVPLFRRRSAGLVGVPGVWAGLLYVACLGYAYLAVEVVLIHELVLFVGHPTYAVTVVVLALLLLSGLGSAFVQRLDPSRLTRALRLALLGVLVLGALQAWVVPPLLHQWALGLPIAARLALTFLCLSPLGFVMGMPFPLGMRILPARAAGMIPWAWALNGFASVAASLGTILLSRLYGYAQAFTVALAFYAVALLLAGRLRKVGG